MADLLLFPPSSALCRKVLALQRQYAKSEVFIIIFDQMLSNSHKPITNSQWNMKYTCIDVVKLQIYSHKILVSQISIAKTKNKFVCVALKLNFTVPINRSYLSFMVREIDKNTKNIDSRLLVSVETFFFKFTVSISQSNSHSEPFSAVCRR